MRRLPSVYSTRCSRGVPVMFDSVMKYAPSATRSWNGWPRSVMRVLEKSPSTLAAFAGWIILL